MLLLVPFALAFESEPVDVLLEDQADLFTNVEYSTGWLPSGSPLQVEFAIEANGGAGVSMQGEGALTWPEALTLSFTGEEGSGIYLLDASLAAVTTVGVDLTSYGLPYSGTFEIDRREIFMDGATFFDPFVLPGADDDRVEVVDTSAGTELISYSYEIFAGVSLDFTADMTPTFTAGFQGVSWSANDDTINAEGAPAVMTPDRVPTYDVDGIYTAQWDAAFDLVFTPTLEVCAPVVGCIEIVSFDIPVELLSDTFDQDFPPQLYSFPLPMLEPGISAADFGTIEPGQSEDIQVPLSNLGDLQAFGDVSIEGTGEFSVFPTQFVAMPDGQDGVVVTFSPTVEGAQSATLVLASNDPTYPTMTIPLTGNAEVPAADDTGEDVLGEDELDTEDVKTCGCQSGSGGAPVALGALAAALLVARRRKA